MKEEKTNFIPMPKHISVYNGTHEKCDMLIGACSCGAWHKIDDWKDKIEKAEQYLDVEIPKQQIIEVSDELFEQLVETAKCATCHRSKCGSLIIAADGQVISYGYNSMPCDVVEDCFKDGLAPTFKSDKTCCIHAEQRAIMNALKSFPDKIEGSTLLFIRLDENNVPKRSGEPYCTICSKLALDAGISRFCLWHKEGWTAYETKHYNELSFKYK